MLGDPKTDRVSRRRAATREEILDAAWDLAAEQGLAGFSLRELAAAVGMQAPSLYEYFSGKHAIYDAMFAQGYRELLEDMADVKVDPTDVEGSLAGAARAFLAFCNVRPARYQLLFQRTIPGFEPSPEAYAPSIEVLEATRAELATLGITDTDAVDLWISVTAGLAAQQLSNEPGGERWVALADKAARMFVTHQRRSGE